MSWRLSLPAGPERVYRWAQLDDYMHLRRREFRWRAPVRLELRARVSAPPEAPGTWGFGFWNDPFTASFGLGGMGRRLPALPNTAWFFYASPPNYLSLRDDLPASGLLAATFRSPLVPAPFLAPAGLALPFLLWPPAARLVRRLASRAIRQSAACLDADPAAWHTYGLQIAENRAVFETDGAVVLDTELTPLGPLGFVLWIDNQYAAFTPQGRLSFGMLPNPTAAWLEVEGIRVD